jgi:hypothetical protein
MRLNINMAVVERENFDRWLFDDRRDQGERSRHLDDILRAKVAAAALSHNLTEPQQAKLRLAGRGDIKRFFDQVEDRRSEFEIDRQSYNTGRAALIRLDPLTRLYREGPFGNGSLFAKTLRRINDDRKAGDVLDRARRSEVPRMTTRGWMIMVAIVALACAVTVALVERSRRFARIARQHEPGNSLFVAGPGPRPKMPDGRASNRMRELTSWHLKMGRKYRRAACYPWLPVAPDPPKPPEPE